MSEVSGCMSYHIYMLCVWCSCGWCVYVHVSCYCVCVCVCYVFGIVNTHVQAFSDSEWFSLLMLAANNAFWSLDTSELQEVAGHLNINLDCCVTLHEILFTMVSSLTKKSEGEVLDILYKRVKDLDASTLFSAELVEVTEAATDGLDETAASTSTVRACFSAAKT